MRVEDRRKEGDIFHIVLPQPLSQVKHLLHAHLGQLPGKHAALKWGTEKEREDWSDEGTAQLRESPRGSAVGFTEQGGVTYLQGGLLIFRVIRRMRFRAAS